MSDSFLIMVCHSALVRLTKINSIIRDYRKNFRTLLVALKIRALIGSIDSRGGLLSSEPLCVFLAEPDQYAL